MGDADDDQGSLEGLFTALEAEEEVFYFNDLIVEDNMVTFVYQFCDDKPFHSQLALGAAPTMHVHAHSLFAIGMCACAWYWMGYNTSRIVVRETVCTKCNTQEACMPFWQALYKEIALEYAYVNRTQLNLVELVLEAPCAVPCAFAEKRVADARGDTVLIPMGGGKDSLVVWHEFHQQIKTCRDCGGSQAKKALLLYVADGMDEYSSSWRLQKLTEMTGDPIFLMRHDFQTQLLHRRKRSYLKPCAHPWAALVLFDSVLAAQLNGVREVQLGYERSADEGNGVFVEGQEVNHQFDKSSAFLALAQGYVRQYIDPEVRVTSTLHGLWEIQIARKFCEAEELRPFLPVFLSCNDPTERGDWCKRCEKCAFIFLLLCAWLPMQQVVDTVFGGENMMLQEGRRREFRLLVGLEGCKPLDCVGTVAEASAAVHLMAARIVGDSRPLHGGTGGGDERSGGDRCSGCGVDGLHKGCSCAESVVGKDVSSGSAADSNSMPPLLRELCEELHIEWNTPANGGDGDHCDGSDGDGGHGNNTGGPVLTDPDAILALWSVDK